MLAVSCAHVPFEKQHAPVGCGHGLFGRHVTLAMKVCGMMHAPNEIVHTPVLGSQQTPVGQTPMRHAVLGTQKEFGGVGQLFWVV